MERYWLLYTPVWGVIAGVVMLGGFAEGWGDPECMAFGLVLAAGACGPALRPHESERGLAWHRRTGVKMVVAVAGFAFGLNWVQTPFFFDVLHMHYGFRVTWTIDRNPVFLYLVTVAYFATYCTLCQLAYRRLAPRIGALAWGVAPLLMALLETALNANPFLDSLFCYDDMTLMLTFGTVVYGVGLALALPWWMGIDEHEAGETRMGWLLVVGGAVLFADELFLAFVTEWIAPHVTTVVEDAPGLRDAGSCLAGLD